ncbi:MAG TPA: glycosyltransferase family 39 protein [Vicinamibacterales bacterium]|nr:glycosyltransferase family 39 protein [Vicinamibacterales bacterium]
MTESTSATGPAGAGLSSTTVCVLLIAGVCLVSFFAGIGAVALWEPDEPRFAEATRQMLLRRDVITPWFNDQYRFEKPILFYWLQLPFFLVLGPTEFAARVPSALCGLLAALAVFFITRDRSSTRAGLFAAMCLATTFRFVLYARQGLTDVPVVAAITCGIWAMSRAVLGRIPSPDLGTTSPESPISNAGRRALRTESAAGSPMAAKVAWICAGAGILLKGPVGLLAPVIWSVWAYAAGGRGAFWRTRPVSGVVILAAIALPWYAAMVLLHGRAFIDVALGSEVVARYLSQDFGGPIRGPLYYWGVWIGDAMPWSLFLIPALLWAYFRRDQIRSGESRAMVLAAIWFVTVLLVFSGSRYKLPHYILPAYPAMAIAVGIFVNAAVEGRVPLALWRPPSFLTGLVLAAGAVLVSLLVSRVFERQPPDAAYLVPLFLVAATVIVGVLGTSSDGRRRQASFAALVGLLAVCYGFLATFVAPRELIRFQLAPPLAAAARRVVADSEPLAVAGGYRGQGLVFYARHTVEELPNQEAVVSFLSGPGRRHCVLPESDLEQVRDLVHRPLRVQAEARMFSVRMKRLLEREPQRAVRTMVLVTAE